MVSRVWHGWTTRANADAYERLLLETILPGIRSRATAGYQGAFLYRRDISDVDVEDGMVEFVTTMLFDSMDDVRAFAGAEYDVAVVPPAARALLARFDARSAHYDVLLSPLGVRT
ncbi:MAG: antibiotic biosynthesis monooxygenase, partial [Gemmatimonadaceae bacterium]